MCLLDVIVRVFSKWPKGATVSCIIALCLHHKQTRTERRFTLLGYTLKGSHCNNETLVSYSCTATFGEINLTWFPDIIICFVQFWTQHFMTDSIKPRRTQERALVFTFLREKGVSFYRQCCSQPQPMLQPQLQPCSCSIAAAELSLENHHDFPTQRRFVLPWYPTTGPKSLFCMESLCIPTHAHQSCCFFMLDGEYHAIGVSVARDRKEQGL